MRLYTFDGSPTSRIVLLFCAEEGIEFEKVDVNLLAGAHLSDDYKKINPCAFVPVLEDGDLRLTESSTILKYLADKYESKAYPRDIKRRAKIHEAMDWLNTSLYRVMGYSFIYPQLYAHHRHEPEAANRATIEWGRQRTRQYLDLLDQHWLGDKRFLCGDELTLADFFGAPMLGQFDLLQASLAPWKNVSRWLSNVRKLKAWNAVHDVHNGYAASLAGREFVALEDERSSSEST
jgi:glutathione S-transferase